MAVSLAQRPISPAVEAAAREIRRPRPAVGPTSLADERRARHAADVLRLAETEAPGLNGPDRADRLRRLGAEVDNLRTALAWSLQAGDPERAKLGLRLAAALWWFWFHRGDWSEGRSWLDRALAAPAGTDDATGDLATARARALCGAGWLAFAQGDQAAARRALEASVALHRRRRDGSGLALAAGFLSQVLLAEGDLAAARRLAGEGVALARLAGGDWGLAIARTNLGNVERARGNPIAAGRLYEEGVAAAHAAGDRWLEAIGLRNLGVAAARTGKRGRGIALLRQTLRLSRDGGDPRFMTGVLLDLAGLIALDGDPVRAARLLGAADAQKAAAGAPIHPARRQRSDDAAALVRAALPAATFAACWANGQAMSFDDALALAIGDRHEPADPTAAGGDVGDATAPTAARPTPGHPPRVVVVAGGRTRDRDARARTPILRVSALGPGRVQFGDRDIPAAEWTYAKPRELLFYILDHPDRTKEQVGRALWPEATAEQLRGSFHVALHHLRRVLGDPGWVRYADHRYAFNRERAIWYDIAAFEDRLAAAARAAGEPARVIAALEGAVAAYGGDYLVSLSGEWIERRRAGLRRAFAEALLRLGDLRLEVGQPTEAATEYRRLLGGDAHHEAAHRGLIRALARQGEPIRAIRHYEAMAEALAAERNVRPHPETTALVDRLRHGGAI